MNCPNCGEPLLTKTVFDDRERQACVLCFEPIERKSDRIPIEETCEMYLAWYHAMRGEEDE